MLPAAVGECLVGAGRLVMKCLFGLGAIWRGSAGRDRG